MNRNSAATRFLYAFLGIILIFYVGYQVFKTNYVPVKTETALEQMVYDSIDTDIFVIRDERYIANSKGGVIIPAVDDGGKVSKGDTAVLVFDSDKAASDYTKKKKLENSISYYTSLQSERDSNTVDPDSLDKDIDDKLVDCLDVIDSGQFENLASSRDKLVDLMTRKQLAVGVNIDFSSKIKQLTNEMNGIGSQSYSELKVPESGYYINHIDKYENSYDYGRIDNITAADVENLMKASPKEPSGNVVGKLVTQFDWYMVSAVDSSKVINLSEGSDVTVKMPFSSAPSVDAKIYKIKKESGGKAVLILRCDAESSALSLLRKETAQICTAKHTGYKVSKKAIQVVDGQKGVYVLRGNKVSFRKIDVVYSGKDFVLADDSNESDGQIQLYDEVITEGKDLYDGKVIN